MQEIVIEKNNNIALLCSSAIGDTIVYAIPFCRWLKKVFPHAKITLITGNLVWNKLIEHSPYIDEKIIIKPWIKGKILWLLKILSKRFDVVFDLSPNANNARLLSFMRTKRSVCLADAPFAYKYTDKIIPDPAVSDRSVVHKNFSILTAIDPTYVPDYSFEVYCPVDDTLANCYFMQHWDNAKKTKIVIHLGGMERNMETGRNPRCWPNDRWVKLLKKIIDHHQVVIVFIWGNDNVAPVHEILTTLWSPTNMYSVAGKSTIPETLWLVRAADMMITSDSWPMHMWLVFQKPIVTFRWPLTPHIDFFVSHPIRKKDVMDISVEEVYAQIKILLSFIPLN